MYDLRFTIYDLTNPLFGKGVQIPSHEKFWLTKLLRKQKSAIVNPIRRGGRN